MVKTRLGGNSDLDLYEKSRVKRSRFENNTDGSESDSSASDVVKNKRRRLKDTRSSANNVSGSPRNKSRSLHLVLSDSEEDLKFTRSGRRVINNKFYSDFNSSYYRKTRHSPDSVTLNKDDAQSPTNIEKHEKASQDIIATPKPKKRSSNRISNSNTFMNGDLSYLDDDDNNIRRSTRQRKVVYDTLNQSWLLGTTTSGAAFRSNSEAQTVTHYEANSFKDTDMYSKVKERHMKREKILYSEGNEKKEEEITENGDGQDADSEQLSSSEEEAAETHSKYYLRPKKPSINRFQPDLPRRSSRSDIFDHPSSPSKRAFSRSFRPGMHCSPHFKNRRHATHNSSSTSSSSDDEDRFERRKKKSMIKARNRFLPMNLANEDIAVGNLKDRVKIGSSLADVDPMALDKSVTFESVGGLNHHLNALKEMIIFPLLYPEVFEKFRISPPRGVLFYGPPGTGKTLVARALANECSNSNHKVAFFMRKGADCLSKWVGESERQLRLLFDQAYAMRPSIIFFDEIDGLAPVRSSRQDQIHSSIVSTMLALMDGLDNRGEVVVIGATNRLDAIDPALRRPGRFDREFNFPLPSCQARNTILEIHTKEWKPPLQDSLLEDISRKCVGYCGADLKALCSEAALISLRHRYPQIYSSRQKLVLDMSSVIINADDFDEAMQKIVPASKRGLICHGHPLSYFVKPYMGFILDEATLLLQSTFPPAFTSQEKNGLPQTSGTSLASNGHLESSKENNPSIRPSRKICFRPRLILCGNRDQGQSNYLGPAILHHLEGIPVHSLDLSALYMDSGSPEENCTKIFRESKRNTPSILYLPHIDQWWTTVNDTVATIFSTLLNDMTPSTPVLFLATSDCEFDQLPLELKALFSCFGKEVIEMRNPSDIERREMFSNFFDKVYDRPNQNHSQGVASEQLEVAPVPEPRKLTEPELNKLQRQEENILRELRMFLRNVINRLVRDRKFLIFAKPVDLEEVPDYTDVISNPMDLETMMQKIDLHKYESGKQFLEDVELICHNALEYNPDKGPSDRLIRHRACALRDAAYDIIETEMDPEFEKNCDEILEKRLKRGENSTKFAPKHYITAASRPDDSMEAQTVSDSEVNKNKRNHSISTGKQTSSGGVLVRCHRRPWFGSRSKKILRCKQPAKNDSKNKEKSLKKDEEQKSSSHCSTVSQESQSAKHNANSDTIQDEPAAECQPKDIPQEKENVQEVIVEKSQLDEILDSVVAVTEGLSIEVIERIHSSFNLCLGKHSFSFNKAELLQEFQDELKRFQECLT